MNWKKITGDFLTYVELKILTYFGLYSKTFLPSYSTNVSQRKSVDDVAAVNDGKFCFS